MKSNCPNCQMELSLQLMQIMDEDVIECPNCSHHFQVQLNPETKAAFESSNQQILDYMSKYPHNEPVYNSLPSGMMDTIE